MALIKKHLQTPPIKSPVVDNRGIVTLAWSQWFEASCWRNVNKLLEWTSGPSDALPLMSGIAHPGVSGKFSRGDHRHPTDTSRASQADMLVAQANILDLYDKRKIIYAGIVTTPTITTSGADVEVSDFLCNLYDSLTEEAHCNRYEITGNTFTLTSNVVSYIYVDYNSGDPILSITTNRDDVLNYKNMTRIVVATCLYNGAATDVFTWDSPGIGLPEKRLDRGFDTENRFSRSLFSGGLLISDAGSNAFTVSAGRIWSVIEPIDCDAVNSLSDDIVLWYRDGSNNWTSTSVTTYDNTHYNPVTGGLSTLTNNRYAVNYLFRRVSATEKKICIVLGIDDYKLSGAQAAGVPSLLPPGLLSFGVYIGKIIVKKSDTTATQITSAFDVGASEVAAVIHNETLERDAIDCHPTSSINNGDGSLALVGTDTHMYNGFVNRTDSVLSSAGTSFSIAPAVTSYNYYRQGLRCTVSNVITFSGLTTNQLAYIYFTSNTGTATLSYTAWNMTDDKVLIATAYSNGSALAVFDERHAAGRDLKNHAYLHDTRGTAYASGLGQTYPTVGAPGYTQIELGVIFDEDIKHSLAQQKRIRNWYQTTGGVWTWANGTDNNGYDRPYIWNAGTSRIRYPKLDSGYALTDVAASRYVCIWVYANNDIDRPIALVTKALTANYTTLAAARAETQPSVGSIAPEFKLIYRWIFKGDGTFVEAADYRLSNPLPGGGTTTAIHNTLLGLDGGETGYYGHLTFAQATNVALINPATNKTLSWTQTFTLSGTDGQTYTFPSTSASIARKDATETFAGRVLVDDVTDATTTTDGSLQTDGGLSVAKNAVIGVDLKVIGKSGFNNTAPIAKPTVSGSRGGNEALASLLTALANYGLITDSTTA